MPARRARTAETVVDRKGVVSAGIPVAYFQRSRSLPTITVAGVDSCPPVSASKNSVPGDWVSGRNSRAGAREIVRREASFEQLPKLVRIQSEGFELSAPFRGSVAESLDTKAAGQTTFDRGFDEVQVRERAYDIY